jgi:hypothetical protein
MRYSAWNVESQTTSSEKHVHIWHLICIPTSSSKINSIQYRPHYDKVQKSRDIRREFKRKVEHTAPCMRPHYDPIIYRLSSLVRKNTKKNCIPIAISPQNQQQEFNQSCVLTLQLWKEKFRHYGREFYGQTQQGTCIMLLWATKY